MRRKRRARRVTGIVIGALALSGCGRGGFETMPPGGGASTTALPSSATAAPATTNPAATVLATTAPATTAPAATAPVTTVPVTTVPVTTVVTTVPLTPEARLLADYDGLETTVGRCLSEPESCEPTAVAVEGSPFHTRFAQQVERYLRDGVRARSIGGVYYVIESTELAADGRSARVVMCHVDGDLLVDPGPTPSPDDDIVIDDSVNTRILETDLTLTPAGWRRWERRILDEWRGEDRCGGR
jgi:hypothetical protein